MRILSPTLLLALATLVFVPQTSATEDCSSTSVHQALEWRSPSTQQVVKALDVHWSMRSGWVHRTLIDGVAEDPTILTQTFDYRDGVVANTWEDSASGWWVRFETHIPVNGDDVEERRANVFGGSSYDKARLIFSDGFAVTTPLRGEPLREAVVIDQVLAKLQADQKLVEAAARIPQSLTDQILFLATHLEQEASPTDDEIINRFDGFQTRPIVQMLSELLRRATAEPGGPQPHDLAAWNLFSGRRMSGSTVSDPELVELVSRFEGLENVDPLSDLPLDDFLYGRCRSEG